MSFPRPSPSELKKLTKDNLYGQLIRALDYIDSIGALPQGQGPSSNQNKQDTQLSDATITNLAEIINSNLKTQLTTFKGELTQEIKAEMQDTIATQISEIKEEYNAEFDNIKEENAKLKEVVNTHQKFLESLDHENRKTVLIITGVSEDEEIELQGETRCTDEDKLDGIFDIIEEQPTVKSIERLGRKTQDKVRPIKVKVENQKQRDAVVENARKLKDKHNVMNITNKIFVKKDQHPLVRQEWQRLAQVQSIERTRPENSEKTVILDRKNRTVTVDGEVVDRFQSFQ